MLWGVFFLFAGAQIFVHRPVVGLQGEGSCGLFRPVVWAAFLLFTAYTVHCSFTEDLVRSVRRIVELRWGRQIGIDLYIGFSLVASLIVMMPGSTGSKVLWIGACLIYGNVASLLYLAIHFTAVVGMFS